MREHLLTLLIGVPLLGSLLFASLPPGARRAARLMALLLALANLLLSLPLLSEAGAGFVTGAMVHNNDGFADFGFQENYPWIPGLGITYSLGVDGISMFLVLLVTGLAPLAVLSGWHSVRHRPRGFFACLTLVQGGMIGALCARDVFLFYLFWELMLLPMFFLIGIWGRTPARIYTTVKFVVYTMSGSLCMLLAMVYVYVRYHQLTGVWSFALADWQGLALAPQEQVWLFWCFVIAFAVKIPLVPLHTWLPDAYSEAPTPAVLLLSGVMAKLGAYGLIRFALPLFPHASAAGLPVLRILAVVAIVYGALIALVQTDLKRLIAYSSISHLGFVVLGIASGDVQGLQGALFQMVSHALSTGALFLLAGMLEERFGTTRLADFGGLAAGLPWLAAALLLAIFSSAGLPGLNGFVGELLIIVGAFHANPVLAGIAATGMVWGACYLLRFYQQTMFGPTGEDGGPTDGQPGTPMPDLSLREGLMLLPVGLLMIFLGIYPQPMLDRSAVVARRWVRVVSVPPMVVPHHTRRNP